MDPLSAGLQLANTIAEIILLNLQSMTPEQRAQQATANLDALKSWQDFFGRILPKP